MLTVTFEKLGIEPIKIDADTPFHLISKTKCPGESNY
jgi:hypothetical protein